MIYPLHGNPLGSRPLGKISSLVPALTASINATDVLDTLNPKLALETAKPFIIPSPLPMLTLQSEDGLCPQVGSQQGFIVSLAEYEFNIHCVHIALPFGT